MNLDIGRTGGFAERAGLALLFAVAAASVAGFGVFRTWPELLNSPAANAFYPRAFSLFPRVQILLALAVLVGVLVRVTRTRWITAFLAVYGVSLASELLGTMVGVPFGPYRYTHLLGPKWFDHVPVLIPISWFTMALPSYALAAPEAARVSPVRRVLVGSLILLAWDLALDPAMSGATPYWLWATRGAYYGMPLMNLVGWFVTGLALMGVLSALGADRWIASLPRRWMALYYSANIVLPLGMTLVAGMWFAVLATLGALAVCAALARHPRPLTLASSYAR